MRLKNWALVVVILATPSFAKSQCKGDCQPGTITGPFTSAQVAEYTKTAPFAICKSASCTSGTWSGTSIEGIDAQQNIGTGYQFYDSQSPDIDDNIAVGPTVSGENAQVLEWLNAEYIQAFDKVTGEPIFTKSGGTTAEPVNVAALWSASTQPECEENLSGNVMVVFDRVDKAFVINRRVVYTMSSGVHASAWCIAISSGTDLSSSSTKWYAYEYRMSTVIPCTPASDDCTTGTYWYYFPDWPRFATWSNGFYITFDLQDPNSGYIESGFEACQLDRADMVKGAAANPMTCYAYTVPTADRPTLIHSVDIADIDSATGPPSGEPEYFLSIVNPSNAQQGSAGLHVCTSTTTPCTSTQLALFTWGASGLTGPGAINVAAYTPGCYNTTTGEEENTYCVPEPSTNPLAIGAYGSPSCGNYDVSCLDSLGDRLANRLTYNNFSVSGGPNGEFLTASHVVMESAANQRTGIRYYVIQVSDGKTALAINSGTAGGPPDLQDPNGVNWYFMPSAALDEDGNMGFTYTTSGPECSSCTSQPHPALNFVVLPWGKTSFDTPTTIVQGTADQENTDRYGEYAATVVDSTDGLTFYGVGEYYDVNQTGTTDCSVASSDCYTWQTRIFRGQYGNPF
ncbi:MAG TPA: hypothetical protein VMD99_04600 [Terriglobales bacterium]|nr:hypothetical protein [Terriglobales bacterium]